RFEVTLQHRPADEHRWNAALCIRDKVVDDAVVREHDGRTPSTCQSSHQSVRASAVQRVSGTGPNEAAQGCNGGTHPCTIVLGPEAIHRVRVVHTAATTAS